MSIENPGFNQFSPENEPSQPFTPERLIAYVRDNEELPSVSQEQLQRLNDKMTHEQVVEYHVTANTLEDQEKSRDVLDQWIPKPKVLYHASRSGNVEEFEPRGRYKRRPDDPPQVFGATSEAVATMMMAPGGDAWHKSGSYDGQRTWTFIYVDTAEFREADIGGYIYELPPDDFTCDPHIGLGLAEWTSAKPVKPLRNPKHYSSSIEAMLQHGVKVYQVNQEMFRRFRDENEDDIELLKSLKPIEQPKANKSNLGEVYDRIYSAEEPVFGGGEPEPVVEKIPQFILSGNALDIGAGEGRHSLYLGRNGFEVTAIDLSEKGISKLKSAADSEGLKVKTMVGDVEDVPLNQEYEVVVSSFMLHHLPRDRALSLIEQIKQQTKVGGVNAITAFTKQGDFYRKNPETSNFYPDSGELQSLYADWEVIEYTEKEGNALSKKEDGSPMVNVSASILARKPKE